MLRFRNATILCLAILWSACESRKPNAVFMESPDRNIQFYFKTTKTGELYYAIRYHKQAVLNTSRLGLSLVDIPDFDKHWTLESMNESAHGQMWSPKWGAKEYIKEYYKQQLITLKHINGYRLQLKVRVYNDGIGLAYSIPKQTELDSIRLHKELTEFHFAKDRLAWVKQGNRFQTQQLRTLSQIKLPLLAMSEGKESNLIRLSSAGLSDYPKTTLQRTTGRENIFTLNLDAPSHPTTTLHSPWRVIQIAPNSTALYNSQLVLNLNKEPQVNEYKWVTTTKYLTLRERSSKSLDHYIQLAKDNRISTLHIPQSLAFKNNDFDKLQKNNLKLMSSLYIDHLNTLSTKLNTLNTKHLSYLDISFAKSTQHQIEYSTLNTIIRWAKQHQIMVRINNDLLTSDLSRALPHIVPKTKIESNIYYDFLNGIHAQTNLLSSTDSILIPELLARAIISGSPIQETIDLTSQHLDGLDLLRTLPTNWKETQVLDAEINQKLIVARKEKDSYDWYIGAVSNGSHSLQQPLKFLSPGYKYEAQIYCEVKDTRTPPKKIGVESNSVLTLNISKNKGCAVRLKFLGS